MRIHVNIIYDQGWFSDGAVADLGCFGRFG